MNLLIDTHALLWLFSGDTRLSHKAKSTFLNLDNTLFFSLASYWEMCLKIQAKKLALHKDWEKSLDSLMEENSVRWLNISRTHLGQTLKLPLIHKDPFDRLLIAQALSEKLVIMTDDGQIGKYAVNTLW
ncbi:MAG: twitching motility protein PilT [Candidatus Raymondbacteria bacterium RifOxyA12_full_50_37]|uniref:Twitching motility protein PilT n=1 Tax=Candidatus Raymondbacteria bacterium RIFOXYD12_FULL_49_13 TaxID=1817890 RepID=A0A1F7FBY7_UNCRA|nr:MAG: twitching motility protein PilT [Candidatus Raymondbacteria bacterium RifOxyA12_full_50_37]OGJ88996.1 MAG: twitching motility protein PilT [Candidatus Raymondbacteria bacterium RIFOXYA2_FULL_49_16]OGJ92505.1 MAG: twitching motility protein PilT [Candidatus Raymondbacteria bacterium RifOxyB12_full_50_8]OGJ97024.1 MAG: twitching motility protein PilT [Candidatus Raymondbacteria bacterium RIFOXYC2_FULL_50_21]OGK04022.1 MAG: twitching motility protein PilT [Candidatus Raymondbacteria bacter